MSPLIDITNTSGQSASDTHHTDSHRKSGVGVSKFFTKTPKSEGENIASPVLFQSSNVKIEEVAIKMCNTQVSCRSSKTSDSNRALPKTHSQPCRKDLNGKANPSHSTDVLLSEAVQTLSLSTVSTQPRLYAQKRVKRHRKKNDCSVDVKNTTVTCSSGLPESPGASRIQCVPQQCVACGLEFTSLPKLAQHLARHVYDGLYAAQWLTQAMHLVNSRQLTSDAQPLSPGSPGEEGLVQETVGN